MLNEILEELKIELSDEDLNEDMLSSKVKSAYREVKLLRKYPSHYSDEKITSDMEQYFNHIKNIALYDYLKIGAEGEKSHNENGINREYSERSTLFRGIVSIVRI